MSISFRSTRTLPTALTTITIKITKLSSKQDGSLCPCIMKNHGISDRRSEDHNLDSWWKKKLQYYIIFSIANASKSFNRNESSTSITVLELLAVMIP